MLCVFIIIIIINMMHWTKSIQSMIPNVIYPCQNLIGFYFFLVLVTCSH